MLWAAVFTENGGPYTLRIMTDRKLDLLICRPTGWHLECPRIGPFMLQLGWYMGRHEPTVAIRDLNISTSRILMIHNRAVERAREIGATHILFLDPDIDAHPQWWEWAWKFSQLHPGSIVAAPYRGAGPTYPVQVFVESGEAMPKRLDNAYAATLHGVWEVESIGSGLMLVDMAVFDRLDQQKGEHGEVLAYFDDTYRSPEKTDTGHTQDGWFCTRSRQAGIRIYCNFDLWAKHQQFEIIGPPEQSPRQEGLLGESCATADAGCLFDTDQSVVCLGTDTGVGPGIGPD